MGYNRCNTGYMDKALAEARGSAYEAKKLARKLGIFGKVKACLVCSSYVKSDGLVVYRSAAGGYGVREHGKVVYHATIESSPTTFHYGAWIHALPAIAEKESRKHAAAQAENARKAYEVRRLKKSFSI